MASETASVNATNMYTNATAQTGTCNNLNMTEGWHGNSSSLGVGQGYYSGVVNQKLFSGSLNS